MDIINRETLRNINEIDLHDWQIKQIICSYDEYRVNIPISKIVSNTHELKSELVFKGVLYTEISYYELWGAGSYISHLDVKTDNELFNKLEKYKNDKQYWCSRLTNYNKIEDDFINFNITLNSGDIIKIIANQVSIE